MPALALLLVVPAATVAVVMLGLGRNLWPRLFFFVAGFGVLVAVEGIRCAARRLATLVLPRLPRAAPSLEAAALAAIVAACLWTLPRAYSPPKQDYGAALRWIEAARRPGEPVLAVGVMTRFVYEQDLPTDFLLAETPADLDASIPRGTSGYAVFAISEFVRSRHRPLWDLLQDEGREVARFPANMNDGDVVVLRIER
jgi:hypothetical protein